MFNNVKSLWKSLFSKKEVVVEPVVEPVITYVSRHAQLRFRERHGVVFSNEMAKEIVENILDKTSEFVKPTYEGAEEWISECKGKKYRVIFNPVKKLIVTVYSGVKVKKRKPSRRKTVRVDGCRKLEKQSRRYNTYKRNTYKKHKIEDIEKVV